VQVGLWRITHFGGRHRSASSGTAATDDRGVYRVYGLEPGRYILLARPTRRLGEQRAVALYYPGRSDESQAEEIEITTGAEIIGIDLTLGSEPSYRIAGKILEVDTEQLGHAYVQAVSGDPGGVSSFSMVDAEGNFALTGLPAGTYILTASERTGIARGDKIFARHKIELRGNLLNLAVRPGRPGSLSGRVGLPPATAARPRPEQVRLRVTDPGDIQSSEAIARAPEYTFEFSSLWPGIYSIQPASPAGAYWKKDPEIAITEGGSASVELEMVFDLGRVAGVAKAPDGGGPLPHARVALARWSGSPVEFRTVQADQRGRWTLPDVRPGEYRICAWPSVEVDSLYAPETWEKAGRAVKRFAVEPAAEVDVELTAVPQ
ncbi:MAG: hypothetical protein HY238_10195, partial [Acidobacteria bacterium]|nr:hypothetical protein [Acidobacteriota bacterium]